MPTAPMWLADWFVLYIVFMLALFAATLMVRFLVDTLIHYFFQDKE